MLIKLSFRVLSFLQILFIILMGGSACWEAIILGHCWEGIKLILCLMLAIVITALMQQYLLWLLPKKERNFWKKSII